MITAFSTMRDSLFGAIGVAATHADSSYSQTACRVVVRRGQEFIGEFAESTVRLDTITLSLSEVSPRTGDTITISGGTSAGVWLLKRRLSDDALTMSFEAVLQP